MSASRARPPRRPRAGDPYDPALHPFELLAVAGLGVCYAGLTLDNRATFRATLVRMPRAGARRASKASRGRR